LGVKASPKGSVPTWIVSTTRGELEARMTDTVPLAVLLTYTHLPSGEIARFVGSSPTRISRRLRKPLDVTSKNVTESSSGFTTQTDLSSGATAIGDELEAPTSRAAAGVSRSMLPRAGATATSAAASVTKAVVRMKAAVRVGGDGMRAFTSVHLGCKIERFQCRRPEAPSRQQCHRGGRRTAAIPGHPEQETTAGSDTVGRQLRSMARILMQCTTKAHGFSCRDTSFAQRSCRCRMIVL
jgi:hypothetical protein